MESWIHRLPRQRAQFRHLQLADGTELKLTAKHFIYKTECGLEDRAVPFPQLGGRPVFAERVRAGDCLFVLDPEQKQFFERRVLRVEEKWGTGIYAPMTTNSDLVVNGVLASCYNVLYSDTLQRSFFDLAREWSFLNLFSGWTGSNSEEVHVPLVTSVMLDLMEFVLPKALIL